MLELTLQRIKLNIPLGIAGVAGIFISHNWLLASWGVLIVASIAQQKTLEMFNGTSK